MLGQSLLEPIVLVAIGIAVGIHAIFDISPVLFACACLVVALGWFECRQTFLFNSDVEKLCGPDAAEPE